MHLFRQRFFYALSTRLIYLTAFSTFSHQEKIEKEKLTNFPLFVLAFINFHQTEDAELARSYYQDGIQDPILGGRIIASVRPSSLSLEA